MPERTAEPLSPELILVSPPEEAALAREQLDDPPQSLWLEPPSPEVVKANGDHSEASWNEFLADVRNRPAEPVVQARPRPPVPAREVGRGRKRLFVAAVALVAVAVVAGLAWARDRAQQRPGSSAASMPVPAHRQATTPKSATHANTTPAPAVTTAPKSKSSPPPKHSKPSTPTRPPAKHTAGFVPTRIWSWAATPGAGAYVVRFLRDGHKVLKIRTGSPRLRLPSSFTFTPGRYRWTVTAIPSKGKGAHVIVNSSFTVAASTG
jgi:hypothetical protein